MSELTRYDQDGWSNCQLTPVPKGTWVMFDDAHAEIRRLEARIKELEDAANILTVEVGEGWECDQCNKIFPIDNEGISIPDAYMHVCSVECEMEAK